MATRRSEEARKILIAKGLIAACASGVFGWLAYAYLNPPVVRDPKDLCKSSEAVANTIVIIDKADPWSADQGNRLADHIWELVLKRMRVEEKLWIFTFVDKVPASAPAAFARCKPPVTGNDITENKKWIESRFKASFSDPLAAVVSDVKRAEDHPCSPIAEAILDVMMRTDFREPTVPNKLVIFSDMRENSREFSLIANSKCAPRNAGPGTLQKLFAARRNEVKIDSVVVYQIPVGDKLASQKISEDERIRGFWNDLFQRLDVPIVWRRL